MTKISIAVQSVSEMTWIDLKEAIVSGTAILKINVDGPLRNDKVLQVVSPTGVVDFDLSETKLHTGTQEIILEFRLACSRAEINTMKSLTWQVATNEDPLIDLKIQTPVEFTIKTPEAVSLVNHSGTIRLCPSGKEETERFAILPKLPEPFEVTRPSLSVVVDGETIDPQTVTLGESSLVNVPVSARGNFWSDIAVDLRLTMTPPADWIALEPGTVAVSVFYPARFKRLAMVIGIAVFVFTILFLSAWIGRLVFTNPLGAETNADAISL